VKDGKHLYEYSVEPTSAGALVVDFVGIGRRVLEIGCGPGSITRILHTSSQCKVTGIELDPEAIARVTPFCERVVRADLNSSDWPMLLADQPLFEVIVAADVLEHLYDPCRALECMRQLLEPKGFVVVSLPHACHAAVACCLVDGDFHYREWGLLDKTHIRFFGLTNMTSLLARAGFKIIDYRFVIKPPEQTEFAEKWSRLPDSLRRQLGGTPHADIYQVVIKAVPLDREGVSLVLAPPVSKGLALQVSWISRVRTYLSRRLDAYPRIKQGIRQLLGVFGVNP
jgi:2-polyprenyl-3-methyl-5-hydroxy-6-metoxy-1,4-benzoquinol methylase